MTCRASSRLVRLRLRGLAVARPHDSAGRGDRNAWGGRPEDCARAPSCAGRGADPRSARLGRSRPKNCTNCTTCHARVNIQYTAQVIQCLPLSACESPLSHKLLLVVRSSHCCKAGRTSRFRRSNNHGLLAAASSTATLPAHFWGSARPTLAFSCSLEASHVI